MKNQEYVYIDVSDGVTKTPKLGHAGQAPYRVLVQVKHTVVIHRKELAERITDDGVALTSGTTFMPPMPPESASVVDVKYRNLEGTHWLSYEILEPYLNDDGQREF